MSEYADADMLDADDQFFHVAQRLIGNIEEGSSPPQDSPPSNAYRHSDYSILTSDQEWPPSSEGHNSIQSFDGVRDVIGVNIEAYATVSFSSQHSSISQRIASATPGSVSLRSTAAPQPDPDNQPSAPSPERHRPEERHAAEWTSAQRLVLMEMHTGGHAREAMKNIRKKLCEELGIKWESWKLSKELRKMKERIIPEQREREAVDTLEHIFIKQFGRLEIRPSQSQNEQMDEIIKGAREQLRREMAKAIQGFAFRMEAARVSQQPS